MVSTRLMRTRHPCSTMLGTGGLLLLLAGFTCPFRQLQAGSCLQKLSEGGNCSLQSSVSSSFQGHVKVSSVAERKEPSGSRYYQNPKAPLMFLSSHSRLRAAWNSLLLYDLEAREQFGHLLVGFEKIPVELKREISHSLLSPKGLQPKCRQQESFHFHTVEICKFKILCWLHLETSSWVVQKNISRLYYLWELVFVLRMSANVYMSISTITR